MGDYRIIIEGTGNHGQQRDLGDKAEGIDFSEPSHSVEARAMKFIADLKSGGENVKTATIEHWPNGNPRGPVDDLLHGKRTGSF